MPSHENLTSFRAVSASSDRTFGIVVGLVLGGAAIWPALRHGAGVRLWLLAPGLILVGLGLVAPRALAPLNRAWFRLGLALAALTNPIVMGVLYAIAIVPLGLFLRRKDLLRLKRDETAASYWIERDQDQPGSLTKQF